MQFPVEECSGCYDNGSTGNSVAETGFYGGNSAIFDQKSGDFRLKKVEVWRFLQIEFHSARVNCLVALGTRRPDRGAFGSVQQAELDGSRIRNNPHCASHGVDFADDLTFGNASDCGIAAHLSNMNRD